LGGRADIDQSSKSTYSSLMMKNGFIAVSALMFFAGCRDPAQTSSNQSSLSMNDIKDDTSSKSLEVPIKRRKAIWEAMGKSQYPEVRPLLTREQFFLHSGGQADVWYNVAPYPEGMDQFEFHRMIRNRADVWDVLISITQLDSAPALSMEQYDTSGWFEWPNSDHTLIITTANEQQIRSWFPQDVQPNEIHIGDVPASWAKPKFVPEGFHQAWLWYD